MNSKEFIVLVERYGSECVAGGAGYTVTAQEQLFEEIKRAVNDQPLLGLATTRQLLEELQARGDVDSVVHQMTGSAYMTLVAKKLLTDQLRHVGTSLAEVWAGDHELPLRFVHNLVTGSLTLRCFACNVWEREVPVFGDTGPKAPVGAIVSDALGHVSTEHSRSLS